MILSDKTIREYIENGTLGVEPLREASVQPASVDLRLGNKFLVVDALQMDHVTLDVPMKYREVESNVITIPPHTFVLAGTMEKVSLPTTLSAFIEGRSSIGRMGLFIQNAGWIDPGFSGHITLQLYNANPLPIKLEAGRRVAQIVFCKMDQEARAYKGKYVGSVGPGGSRIFKDKELDSNKN